MTSSILVKLPNWMGDILFSFDLLYTLCHRFERVAAVTSGEHAELFSIFPFLNLRVISYAPESWPYLDRDTITAVGDFNTDLGLVLPNSIGSALLLRYAGVPRLYGYNTEHRGFLLEKSLPVPVHRMHQTAYYNQLLTLFDLQVCPFPVPENAKSESIVVLHPGASKKERAWHLERFLQIAHHVTELGFTPIFVSGEAIDVTPFEAMIRPTLTQFTDLLRRSRVFVGNDSGPLHLAQQCGATVVGIYGPGDPNITGPRPLSRSRVLYHSFPCSPCRQKFFHECSPSTNGKPFCIETIGTEEVLRAIRELLV